MPRWNQSVLIMIIIGMKAKARLKKDRVYVWGEVASVSWRVFRGRHKCPVTSRARHHSHHRHCHHVVLFQSVTSLSVVFLQSLLFLANIHSFSFDQTKTWSLSMSTLVTNSLTHSLNVDFLDVTLANEDDYSMLVNGLCTVGQCWY